jgi:hypothetical protein
MNVTNISTYLSAYHTDHQESLTMDQTEYAESIINKYADYLGNRKIKKTSRPSDREIERSREDVATLSSSVRNNSLDI